MDRHRDAGLPHHAGVRVDALVGVAVAVGDAVSVTVAAGDGLGDGVAVAMTVGWKDKTSSCSPHSKASGTVRWSMNALHAP